MSSPHGFCTHSCHCRKAAPHGSSVPEDLCHFLQFLLALAAHPSAPSNMYPSAPTPQLRNSYTWRRGASLYFTAQRFSTSDSPCQEQLCSLPHQSGWLHHMWDSLKGHGRFLQVKTYTAEPVNSQVCDTKRINTKLPMEPGLIPLLLKAQPFTHWEGAEESDVSTSLKSRQIFTGLYLVHTPLGLWICEAEYARATKGAMNIALLGSLDW